MSRKAQIRPQHRPNLRILRDLWLSGLCGLSQTSMPGVVRSGLAVGGSSALGGGAVESEALPHVWLAARYVSYLLCSCSCSTIIKFCQRSDVCLGQAKQHRLLWIEARVSWPALVQVALHRLHPS